MTTAPFATPPQPSLEQRAALFTAVETGDTAALEALFQREGLRAAVDATEQHIRSHEPSDVRYAPQAQDVTYPWYCMPMPTKYQRRHVFAVAVLEDQVEVVEWLLSRERIALMRATLAFMWPHMAAIAMNCRHAAMLELLLDASASLFPDQDQCQKVVSELVGGVGGLHVEMVRVVIAHGAEIHTTAPLVRCAGYGSEALVEMLAEEGAIVVGADVLGRASDMGRCGVARTLMQLGADFGSASEVLHIAAQEGSPEIVRLYVDEGFVDFDARDLQGQTALMRLVSKDELEQWASIEDMEQVARGCVLVQHCIVERCSSIVIFQPHVRAGTNQNTDQAKGVRNVDAPHRK